MKKTFTAKVQYDSTTDEYFIPFEEEVTKKLGWNIGDKLVWTSNNDGSYTISKKEKVPELDIFLVETVSIFRHRYAIKAKSLEHAYDTVVLQEAEEFSQYHVGEDIVSGRKITEEEYLELYNQDNEYLSAWTDDKKKEYIHIVDYEKE